MKPSMHRHSCKWTTKCNVNHYWRRLERYRKTLRPQSTSRCFIYKVTELAIPDSPDYRDTRASDQIQINMVLIIIIIILFSVHCRTRPPSTHFGYIGVLTTPARWWLVSEWVWAGGCNVFRVPVIAHLLFRKCHVKDRRIHPSGPYSVQSVGAAKAVSLAIGHNPGWIAAPTQDTSKLTLILPTSEGWQAESTPPGINSTAEQDLNSGF